MMTLLQTSVRVEENRLRRATAVLAGIVSSGCAALVSGLLLDVGLRPAIRPVLLGFGLMGGAVFVITLIATLSSIGRALRPGWIEVSAAAIDMRRSGHNTCYPWADLGELSLVCVKGQPIGCKVKVLATGKTLVLAADDYTTDAKRLLGFLLSARSGEPIALREVVIPLKDIHCWPRSLGRAVALWTTLWFILIGGVGAMFAASNIHDAHLRAELARRGVLVNGTISGRGARIYMEKGGCGKGGGAAVRFMAKGKVYTDCIAWNGLPPVYMAYLQAAPPPEAPIPVAYETEDPARFALAPGGQVPQRDISAVWSDWLMETLVLLALFVPSTAVVLYRQRRKTS